jgi:hypothetical protein
MIGRALTHRGIPAHLDSHRPHHNIPSGIANDAAPTSATRAKDINPPPLKL